MHKNELTIIIIVIISTICPLSPSPQLLSQQEMSVYDLRDHPDFRYRPGSVVIRVANFEENQSCYTGQVLDNFPSGEVSVFVFTDENVA